MNGSLIRLSFAEIAIPDINFRGVIWSGGASLGSLRVVVLGVTLVAVALIEALL